MLAERQHQAALLFWHYKKPHTYFLFSLTKNIFPRLTAVMLIWSLEYHCQIFWIKYFSAEQINYQQIELRNELCQKYK